MHGDMYVKFVNTTQKNAVINCNNVATTNQYKHLYSDNGEKYPVITAKPKSHITICKSTKKAPETRS